MFKIEKENWVQQEYEQEKRRIEKEFGKSDPERKEVPRKKNENKAPNMKYAASQSESKKESSIRNILLMKTVFSIYGFIFSWTFVFIVVKFLVLRFVYIIVYVPIQVITVTTFFAWGAVFLILRKKVLSIN